MATHSDHIDTPQRGFIPVLRSVLSCVALVLTIGLTTAFRMPYFSHLSVEDGLSQSTVFSICQDSTGFMWFGTMDGLSRYDGYDFLVWRHSPSDSTSISSDIVRHVFSDSDGRIWLGTPGGLSLYDAASDSFRNWAVGEVGGIAAADGGDLYIAADGKLLIFNPETGTWRSGGLGGGVFTTTLCRDGNSLWIATDEAGLFRLDTVDGEIRKVPEFTSVKPINSIFPYGETLWIATEGDGLWRLELNGKYCVAADRFSPRDGLPSSFVRSLAADDSGRLWVGTYGGLSILEDGSFTPVLSDSFREGALSQNSVRSICRDSQGGMWLGTYFGGLNYWHPLRNHFSTLHRQQYLNSLNDNVVSCMAEDADGRVWIGTNTGGVNLWDSSKGTFRYWPMKSGDGNSPESNDVKAIWVDDAAGKVYVGAHAGGLSCISMDSGAVKRFDSEASSAGERLLDVYSIIPKPSSSMLWLGTLEGVRLFDRRTGKISVPGFSGSAKSSAMNSARSILLDSYGRLWAGGGNGLTVFSVSDGCLSLCREIEVPSGLYVHAFLEVPGKSVWVGTREGLWGYSFSTAEWSHYTVDEGLPSNIVDGIESDEYGMIWISTDRGISRFNPFTTSFRNFTVEDGLSGNQFNPSSSLRRDSKEILFGGIDGITVFSPELFSDNPYSPQPVITGFRLSGKYASESVRLNGSEIVLSYDRNSFSMSFSVPNYLSGHHDTFAYMLEGYDEDWTETTSQRTASWSNLPHGEYLFRLKSANSDGKWCGSEATLRIMVRPVWYRTVPALTVFGFMIALTFVALYLLISRRKDRQKKEELDIQEQTHREELQQMKTRFFINISHEMRTPLMLIVNPLEEMIARCNDLWMRRQLKYLDRNARRLLHLVNQLIDYRRAELGVFRLSVRPEPVMKIIRENWSYYEVLAQKKKLKYRLESSIGDAAAFVDAQYLELILNNLLSNAFKYTDSGSVTLSAELTPAELVLQVSDTGAGIPKDRQKQIFERFYQVERDNIGSGIGLSLVQRLVELHHGTIELDSEPGRGSTFTIHLPQTPSAYSAEELGGVQEVHSAKAKDRYVLDPGDAEGEDNEGGQSPVPEETGGSLLIAEDNEDIAVYLRDSLSDSFEIRLARDGEQALSAVGESLPDIVITDLNMPVMDGLKLCMRLKQNVETSDIPVIMISSSTDYKDQLAAFRAGADDFMSKPFQLSILQAKIRNMLRTRARVMDKVAKSSELESGRVGLSAYDEELLTKAASIVEKNMDNADFSTEDFAAEMGMSRSNLHLKLKALTGESALDFIRRIRFKEACRLLKDGRYSISVISDLVGFNSPSYFATCFKRYMGCLPTEWGRKGGK